MGQLENMDGEFQIDQSTAAELDVEGADAGLSHLVVQRDGPATDDVQTEWVTDPDGNHIELVVWPDGHPDGMTAADFPDDPAP